MKNTQPLDIEQPHIIHTGFMAYGGTQPLQQSEIQTNESYEAESLELQLHRMLTNGEPITNTAPTIYTERKDGVIDDYNIRTDRFDKALDAMDSIHKGHIAAREERIKERNKQQEEPKPTETTNKDKPTDTSNPTK